MKPTWSLNPDMVGLTMTAWGCCSLSEALARSAECGLKTVEAHFINLSAESGRFYCADLDAVDWQRVEEALTPFDHFTVHAPQSNITPVASNPIVREESLWQIKDSIVGAGRLGAGTVVVHKRINPEREARCLQDPHAIDVFRGLGDYATEHGTTIGVENAAKSSQEYIDFVRGIDHPAVGANVDIGHIACFTCFDRSQPATEHDIERYNREITSVLKGLNEKILSIHLHDVLPGDWRDHQIPGKGLIDFPNVIRCLREMEYSGTAILETAPPDEALAAREWLLGL